MHNLHKYDEKNILFPNSFHGTKMGSVGVVNQILGYPGEGGGGGVFYLNSERGEDKYPFKTRCPGLNFRANLRIFKVILALRYRKTVPSDDVTT